jgi:hypothetical protein
MPTKTRFVRDSGVDEAAVELDLSEDTVRRDIRRGAPHSRKQRRILLNVVEYQRWRQDQGLSGERGRPPDASSGELADAKLRKENALAAKYEHQVQKDRGELIPLVDVRRWVSEQIGAAKNKLIGLGAAVTPHLEGRDAAERQKLIDDRVTEILNDLAGSRGALAPELEAAGEVHAQPVGRAALRPAGDDKRRGGEVQVLAHAVPARDRRQRR